MLFVIIHALCHFPGRSQSGGGGGDGGGSVDDDGADACAGLLEVRLNICRAFISTPVCILAFECWCIGKYTL